MRVTAGGEGAADLRVDVGIVNEFGKWKADVGVMVW